MSDLDVIPIPGYPGMWARRVIVQAWQAAGSPHINSAGRLYSEQKAAYLSPGLTADNPDNPNARLAHVRGMALDIAYTAAITARLLTAGFTQPIWRRAGFGADEPWHFELARYVSTVRRIPLVTERPTPTTPTPPMEDDDMLMLRIDGKHLAALAPGVFRHFIATDPYDKIMRVSRAADDWQDVTTGELPALLRTYGVDVDVYRVAGNTLEVLDPLTGTYGPGNLWSAANATRALLVGKASA